MTLTLSHGLQATQIQVNVIVKSAKSFFSWYNGENAVKSHAKGKKHVKNVALLKGNQIN